jgi:hypothetical protein
VPVKLGVDLSIYRENNSTVTVCLSDPIQQGDYEANKRIEKAIRGKLNNLCLLFSPTSSWLSRIERWLRRVKLSRSVYKIIGCGNGLLKHEEFFVYHKGELVYKADYKLIMIGRTIKFKINEELN